MEKEVVSSIVMEYDDFLKGFFTTEKDQTTIDDMDQGDFQKIE